MSPKSKNRRLNLRVSLPVYNQLKAELQFLDLDSRLTWIEETHILTCSDFLRSTIAAFVRRYLDQGVVIEAELDAETTSVPFYLDRTSEGLWNTAIQQGIAVSYNQLADFALLDYFDRQAKIAASLRQDALLYKNQILSGNLSELRRTLLETSI
ncbi:hypothetical protein H6F43_03755 [Leptolyngbya sp. FACHB-36]|uniref:hypothetical protein n=1 Tax=Leptolyngbya sp. FACHB-36 TaxID=2692808 RepID=UPI0016814FDA|nr:hypothetical protein [Leptolyngbya sp. FACHB-36]MBD2019297.1 hypothetical protein [Leptolyngbya sp. FACHB-36]